MQLLKQARFIWILLGFLLIASCGFHLRGEAKIPQVLQNVYIESASPYADFELSLAKTLRTYNINVVDDPNEATMILKILNSSLSQTAGAVSANLQTRQYTLTYSASFQLLAPNHTVIVDGLSAYSTTTFIASLSQMSSSSNIPSEYQIPLENDLIFRMINHILSNQTQKIITDYFSSHSAHENSSR